MRPETQHNPLPAMALPLIATMLIGGCQGGTEPAGNVAAATAPAKPLPSPAEHARGLVLRHLGVSQGVSFAASQVFTSQGATIVCGRVAQAGQPAQRYITVGQEDVFVEGQMQPGHMDQAVTEFCRNA